MSLYSMSILIFGNLGCRTVSKCLAASVHKKSLIAVFPEAKVKTKPSWSQAISLHFSKRICFHKKAASVANPNAPNLWWTWRSWYLQNSIRAFAAALAALKKTVRTPRGPSWIVVTHGISRFQLPKWMIFHDIEMSSWNLVQLIILMHYMYRHRDMP